MVCFLRKRYAQSLRFRLLRLVNSGHLFTRFSTQKMDLYSANAWFSTVDTCSVPPHTRQSMNFIDKHTRVLSFFSGWIGDLCVEVRLHALVRSFSWTPRLMCSRGVAVLSAVHCPA